MGHEFYVALEKDIGISSGNDPTILLSSVDNPNLEEMAVGQGLHPLWSFFSSSLEDQQKLSQEYGLPPEELEEIKKVTPPERWCELEFNCPEQWFKAEEGLKTVQGLLTTFRNNLTIPNSEFIIVALETTEQVLDAANIQSVRFHFAAIPE